MSIAALEDEWPDRNGVFQVDNDKLYIPYELFKTDGSGSTQFRDSSWIMVVSYPELEYRQIIRDGRSSSIGCYFGMQGIQQVDDKDIYTWSTAINSKNPSAVMRIKQGKDEFDTSYFFNVEEKTGGWKINRADYISGYKFLASFHQNNEQAALWQGRAKLAIVDVKEESVTWITGVPEHTEMAYKHKVYVEKDKKTVHYVFKDDDNQLFVYNIDVASATGKKGLEFVGMSDITTISKLSY
ncbi:MAG: DUF4374 domain-containing protein [Tannerellaceae bacterium]|jgi:hypothetical protein|nr:DUF4374 domain-containing protein [Tannerellaceae bacterium]